MRKWLFIWMFLFACKLAFSQPLPSDSIYIEQLYDRCMNFSADKADSLNWYADYIIETSNSIRYKNGVLYGLRLKGIAFELKSDYEKAIQYYLKFLDTSRAMASKKYETSALSDLAILYTEGLKRPDISKNIYREILNIQEKDSATIAVKISTLVNLGAIYNRLNMMDSALYFLDKGLTLAIPYQNQIPLSSIYNNIGNAYFKKKAFNVALEYFQKNYTHHLKYPEDDETLWLDYLNIADCYIELKKYDSANVYAVKALQLSQKTGSLSDQKESYAILSKLRYASGAYKEAYNYQQHAYSLDTSLLNIETTSTVAKLQEQYNAVEREKENKLLQAGIEKEHLRQRIYASIAIASLFILLLIAYFLLMKRIANSKLQKLNTQMSIQNDKLAQLNYEKNTLISMVSHDLGTPFASVKMWASVLKSENGKLETHHHNAIEKIMQSAVKGETMIRNILDVEKAETNKRKIEIEEINISKLLGHIAAEFEKKALQKNINLFFEQPKSDVFLNTDRMMIERILENLLSNAIKFTNPGKQIWLTLTDNNTIISISVKDEGQGIPIHEQTSIFSKYGKISTKPTGGEPSTGLGLSIVKRIVEELNGQIQFESEPGKGSQFTVKFDKK